MNLIEKWLAGPRNFHIGAVLYSQYGQDEKLKKYFSGNPDDVKRQLLQKELSLLAAGSLKHPRQPAVNPDTDEMPIGQDPVLSALQLEWKPIYQRMQYLRYELDRYPGNSKEEISRRHLLAKEILELEQACMRVWQRRDHYQKCGTLPEVSSSEEPLPTDPVKLGKLIEGTKRNIRRNKQAVIDNPANTTYPLKVIYYEKLYSRIMKQLNDAKGS